MKDIYVAFIDEVPSLSLEPHEICEPDPLTSEEIVTMWSALKKAYEKVIEASKENQ
jgi:hypothetical protein